MCKGGQGVCKGGQGLYKGGLGVREGWVGEACDVCVARVVFRTHEGCTDECAQSAPQADGTDA